VRTIFLLAVLGAALALPAVAEAHIEAGVVVCNAADDTCIDLCLTVPNPGPLPPPVPEQPEAHLCKVVVVSV
jgi:hypothetical protein